MHFFLNLNLLIHVLAQFSLFLKKNTFHLNFLKTKAIFSVQENNISNKRGQSQPFLLVGLVWFLFACFLFHWNNKSDLMLRIFFISHFYP